MQPMRQVMKKLMGEEEGYYLNVYEAGASL
jgi:hypothetical protein